MLRQVAVLLERENATLHAKVQTLTAELARLQGDPGSLVQRELEFLKELLAQRERALFGASSERRPPAADDAAPPAPRRGHGPTEQPRLPTVEVVHELAVPDQTCPQCGGTLCEMPGQTEDAEEITVVERRFVLVTHRRKKYRCRCNGCVETAPGPLRLTARPDVRGGRYAPEFAVEVAIGKYLDHLPRERPARVMAREGLTIESQTFWDQLDALATVLQPTYEALRRHVLAAPVVGADETWWRLLHGPERPRWWTWSLTREDAVTYTILESRSQAAARQVLDGYRGIVVADGYGAYDALARAGPGFTLAHCWAHVRRKFVEAEPHYPATCGEILDLIGQLYAVERAGPGTDPAATEETRAAALDLRARLRRERSTSIVEAIRTWARAQRHGPRQEKSLRLALQARDRGRRALLQPHRVREALRGRAEGVPAAGDPRRPRESGGPSPSRTRCCPPERPDRSGSAGSNDSGPGLGEPRGFTLYQGRPGRQRRARRFPGGGCLPDRV